MRGYVIVLGAVLTVAGCAGEPDAPPVTSGTAVATGSAVVDPAAVARVRSELPPGYEVGDLADHAAPASFWGMKPDWTATPAQCGVLADPAPGTPVHGWSASGPGGIVYAMVSGPGTPAALPDGCAAWTLTGGRTTATVTAVAPPQIHDTPTVAMSAVATTVVEGGTETRSHADTVSAYLESGYVASVTVVTDPGSALPALGPEVAARLLTQTVTAIRGAGR
ncbi:DUF5642 family protein [Mycobacterium sp. AMU20-3851]|uniref:DUF5642 family protein n=1 Tax=Mycobacterium sp. AMU20-3851 TaxID=3122055 RepID=UPI0037548346